MGLDMHLRRKTILNRDYVKGEDDVWRWINPDGFVFEGVPLLPKGKDGIEEIIEEAMYWRKANAIHSWFVTNVQDGEDECRPHYVSVEQLQSLVDTCKRVLENRERAGELLPPQSGFFFGSTDIDEYYFQDLQRTVDQLEPLIQFEKDNAKTNKHYVSYEYQSSW